MCIGIGHAAEEVFYPVYIVDDSISVQLNHRFIVDDYNRQHLVLFNFHETWQVEPLLTEGDARRS